MTTSDDERPTIQITMDEGTFLLVQAVLELERGEVVDPDEIEDKILAAIKYLGTDRRKEN
ncbi:hypothetical protein SAMN05443432_11269 [Roseovarius litoreus]|uniref:Uncharacterized protein n=1 Tax=Roseovarius litoreus TaxID=1155722 RepID=A0A1M7KXW2_9RHOB|nr:hypothetical protein [Roseovarius litoreus]SHM70499.1 hypothetical protein SAMN05443432_11269 [Roseovarius litoreus]